MAVWNQSHDEAVDGSLDHCPWQEGYGQPRQGIRGKFVQLRHVLGTNLDARSVLAGGDINTGQRQRRLPYINTDHLKRRALLCRL